MVAMSPAAVMLEVSLSLIVAFERVSVVVTFRRRRLLVIIASWSHSSMLLSLGKHIVKSLYFSILFLGGEGEIDL